MSQSYHDLAVRLEPIILELERERNDVLLVAHESVLRVLYGYLMACNAADIPNLKFPRNEIIEVRSAPSAPTQEMRADRDQIIPASYNNHAKRIPIPNLPDSIIPDSPEDIKIPVIVDGSISPINGMSTPVEPVETA